MKDAHIKRVVFYSKQGMATPYNLENAEKLLSDINFGDKFDINSILELYKVKLYFDNKLYLNSWDEAKR